MSKRRERNRKRETHLFELDVLRDKLSDILLEDLRLYVGSPEDYIPLVFTECLDVLKRTKRYYLTELDNEDDLDEVWDRFHDMFDETKYRRLIARNGSLSYRMDDYNDRVADFYMYVFDSIYTAACKAVVEKNRKSDAGETNIIDYECKVHRVKYDSEGFETEVICVFKEVLTLGTINLAGGEYVD